MLWDLQLGGAKLAKSEYFLVGYEKKPDKKPNSNNNNNNNNDNFQISSEGSI